MRSGRTTRRADGPDRLAALDEHTLGHVDAIEMEVQRVEPEAVVEHHEPACEEEVADHRDPSAIGRYHRRTAVGRVVGA